MHARRYLFKALEYDEARMGPALHLIARLYRVEERGKTLSLSAELTCVLRQRLPGHHRPAGSVCSNTSVWFPTPLQYAARQRKGGSRAAYHMLRLARDVGISGFCSSVPGNPHAKNARL